MTIALRSSVFYKSRAIALQKLGHVEDGLQPAYIITGLSINAWMIMEAEQLNIVTNRLVDLAQRATELRRYL